MKGKLKKHSQVHSLAEQGWIQPCNTGCFPQKYKGEDPGLRGAA